MAQCFATIVGVGEERAVRESSKSKGEEKTTGEEMEEIYEDDKHMRRDFGYFEQEAMRWWNGR